MLPLSYLKSPANLGNLYSVMEELERRGWLDQNTTIAVGTAAVRSPERSGGRLPTLATDWVDPTRQADVLRALLGRFPRVSVDIKPPAGDLAHHRSLTLQWGDGRALSILPDQGFSLVRPHGNDPFPFGLSAIEQASEIMRLRWGCEAASSLPTVVYVRAV